MSHKGYKIFNEKRCEEVLAQIRWDDNPICPRCDHNKIYLLKGYGFKCAKCRKRFTVRTNTIFEGTKIPLQKWFYAFYLIGTNFYETSIIEIQRKLDITNKTAWIINKKIRYSLKHIYPMKEKEYFDERTKEMKDDYINKLIRKDTHLTPEDIYKYPELIKTYREKHKIFRLIYQRQFFNH